MNSTLKNIILLYNISYASIKWMDVNPRDTIQFYFGDTAEMAWLDFSLYNWLVYFYE